MAIFFDYPRMLFRQLFHSKKDKTLHFDEVGWTITIPGRFYLLPADKMNITSKRNIAKIEAVTQEKITSLPAVKQFYAEYEMNNSFTASIIDLQQVSDAEWNRKNDNLQNTMLNYCYAIFKDYAHVNIATETDARQKGNILFKTFEIIVTTPQRELHRVRFLTTIYKNHGLTITMSFEEPKIGEEMLNALRSSTFSV